MVLRQPEFPDRFGHALGIGVLCTVRGEWRIDDNSASRRGMKKWVRGSKHRTSDNIEAPGDQLIIDITDTPHNHHITNTNSFVDRTHLLVEHSGFLHHHCIERPVRIPAEET